MDQYRKIMQDLNANNNKNQPTGGKKQSKNK